MPRARAQGKHAGLTRDQVLRAALALVDRDGLAALSMRRLARDLDVEAMTLYHHVHSKQGLEDALVEQVLADALPGSPTSGSPWQDVIAAHAQALHEGLSAHPGAVPLFASRPALTARNLDQLERLLEVLTGAGFAPGPALELVHAVGGAVVWHHLAARDDRAVPARGTTDLPLVSAALATRPASPDDRLTHVVRALTSGFSALLDDR